MKRLVVNADDFGFTRDVNEGIVEAHRRGILTATTLMANGGAFEDAVRLARENPGLDVGCHLVLVSGASVAGPNRLLPATVGGMLRAIVTGRLRPLEELRAQVLRITGAGIRPTHLDTHKHTHLFPPVLNAVAKISCEFGIPWVRRPFDFPLNGSAVRPPLAVRLTSRCLSIVRGRFHRTLAAHGCRTTDHFAGFQITGHVGVDEVVQLIRKLPQGLTEFMCHPGRCGPELMKARTRLKESRERELHALVAPEVRDALDREGVELVAYRDLL